MEQEEILGDEVYRLLGEDRNKVKKVPDEAGGNGPAE